MKRVPFKKTVIVFAAIALALLIFTTGFFIGRASQEKRFAELMIGQATDSIGALIHLERNNHQFAKERLIQSIDGQIIILSQLESANIDEASKELRGLILQKFAEVRSAQPSKNLEEFKNIDDIVEAYVAKYKTDANTKPRVISP